MKQHVLFDLDGTLTDSAPGIVRCLEYAVQSVTGSRAPHAIARTPAKLVDLVTETRSALPVG